MIKEIEVGGVKHSITLADDMVGSGLTRTGSGAVCLNLPKMPIGGTFVTGLVVESGQLCINMHTLGSSMAGSGLRADDTGRLSLVMETLAGTGLTQSNDGKALCVTALGLVSDLNFMSTFASGLCGTGLVNSGGILVVSGAAIVADAGFIREVSNGLLATSEFASGLSTGIAGMLAGTGLSGDYGKLSFSSNFLGSGLNLIDGMGGARLCVTVGKGIDVDSSLTYKPIYVKIAKRDSGLRLFFNSKGELDVTQD